MRFPSRASFFLLSSLSLLPLRAPAAAQRPEPSLDLLHPERKLTLTGVIEDEPTKLEGVFWVTLRGWGGGKPDPQLRLLPTHLSPSDEAGHSEVIAISQLSVDQPTLSPDQRTQFKITVKDIAWPGLYSGRLDWSLEVSGNGAAEAAELNRKAAENPLTLELDVRTRPKIVAPEAEIKLNVVNCAVDLTCWLAGLFVPDSTPSDPWVVELQNVSLQDVLIQPQPLIRNLETGRRSLEFGIERSRGASDRNPPTEHVGIARTAAYKLAPQQRLHPGNYAGDLQFIARPVLETALLGRGPDGAVLVRNQTDVRVKTTIAVRAGVGIPLLLILLGIVAGRLNRQISTPEAEARLKLYDDTVVLAGRISKLAHKDTRLFLRTRLVAARRQLDDLTLAEDVSQQAVNHLRAQIGLIEELEEHQHELDRLSGRGIDVTQVRTKIAHAQRSILTAEDEPAIAQARATLDRISAEVRGLAATQATPAGPARAKGPKPAPPEVPEEGPPALVRWVAKMLGVLSGTRQLGIGIAYWYIRPLATLAFLIALAAAGVSLLYSESSTFGANRLADYFPLFLWGFGEDVITKRMQQIRFTSS